MERDTKSLLALTVFCAFSATLFGLGTDIFSFRGSFAGDGREILMIVMRVVVYITLALVLVFKGAGRESWRLSLWRSSPRRRNGTCSP